MYTVADQENIGIPDSQRSKGDFYVQINAKILI
jgi:hypothetical protein